MKANVSPAPNKCHEIIRLDELPWNSYSGIIRVE